MTMTTMTMTTRTMMSRTAEVLATCLQEVRNRAWLFKILPAGQIPRTSSRTFSPRRKRTCHIAATKTSKIDRTNMSLTATLSAPPPRRMPQALPAPPTSTVLASRSAAMVRSHAAFLMLEHRLLRPLVVTTFPLSPEPFTSGVTASVSRMAPCADSPIQNTPWTCR